MLKTRIILIAASAILIWLIFLLPKVVVDNEDELGNNTADSSSLQTNSHPPAPKEILAGIRDLRLQIRESTANEKNAIFADSLSDLYQIAGKSDSSAWFAEEAAKFFNNVGSWIKAGDQFYQAYTLALDQPKQNYFAEKTREYYEKVLDEDPDNLDVKTKMAMTYLSSQSPMLGITMLREVLGTDPNNELALFNLGMLSIQSGQYDKAVERLEALVKINPAHVQGHLLLGIALMNTDERLRARAEFEKVKQMDRDPAVQATVDSYLKDLK
ncbi:MAG: tetratricopeptide repeat protein [Cyclobacteriaceae bacterium]|jgi:tetratricopeptide (TPR) repeat protein|nr:tetratricopeptide repeat protein [Cyclobacteriaceae bacterium]MDH4298076.1 tetratricopeptide repeat protein [Cyclobacteriaceae bacterium]MDH5247398.1 tetratricopeptide repeat protein [Cyclobacteriaceae bacterium]